MRVSQNDPGWVVVASQSRHSPVLPVQNTVHGGDQPIVRLNASADSRATPLGCGRSPRTSRRAASDAGGHANYEVTRSGAEAPGLSTDHLRTPGLQGRRRWSAAGDGGGVRGAEGHTCGGCEGRAAGFQLHELAFP